jgi:hypothetical protein
MNKKYYKNTRYIVDESGDVFSTISNKYLNTVDDGKGYPCVTLWIDGTSEKYKIHRLVAELFVENPNNSDEVNHKDGNKLNSHFTNLEWCTHTENMKHAWDLGLMRIGSETTIAKLDETDVIEIQELMIKGLTNQEIAERYLVARGTVSKIRDKKTWKHVRPGLVLPESNSKYSGGKLSIEDVKEIRILSEAGFTNNQLAETFKVHNGTIHGIVTRKSYINI